jgi:hypothetical protein
VTSASDGTSVITDPLARSTFVIRTGGSSDR